MTYATGDFQTSLHYSYNLGAATAEVSIATKSAATSCEDAGNDVVDAWAASDSIKAMTCTQAKLDGFVTRDLTGVLQPFQDSLDIDGLKGTGTESPSVCVLNTWYTGAGGRSRRGRTYWPFVAFEYYDSETARFVSAASSPSLVDCITTFMGELDSSGPNASLLAVNSRRLKQLHGVTAMQFRTYVGSQRRRLPQP